MADDPDATAPGGVAPDDEIVEAELVDDEPGDDDLVEAELIEADLADDEAPAGLDDMLGALGGLDMSSLLGSAMQLQQQMLDAQTEAEATEVEGQAGGGAVRVVVTGGFDFRRVEIAPEAVDPDDVEMLQDLVLAAVRDAVTQARGLTQNALPSLGGFGLPDLGGAATGGGVDLSALLGGGPAIDDDDFDDELDDEDDEPLP